ncbi:hypothetical protein L1049_019772 [Liquidambar formosana]|uniref:Uncharacterized protein n=1 Tax=Liquidambar formosana TaxID=63359 RepID=A0AAP0S750_LIQFO
MGRAPCCDKHGVRKGAWTPEEDEILVDYIMKHGTHGTWRSLPKLAGLLRCGKSCRLRWTNYLRPNIKRGPFTPEEESSIIQLHGMLGNKWAAIAAQIPGRTDNEIKNFWNTHLKKRLLCMGHNLQTQRTSSHSDQIGIKCESPSTRHMVQWESARVEAEARLSMESSLLSNPSSTGKTGSDFFLRMWNSEVGESFRKSKGHEKAACQSPISQTSSSTKFGSGSAVTMPAELHRSTASNMNDEQSYTECKNRRNYAEVMVDSDCSSSYEMDDSDTALKLLLDFPCSNDMGFYRQAQKDNFSPFGDFKFE